MSKRLVANLIRFIIGIALIKLGSILYNTDKPTFFLVLGIVSFVLLVDTLIAISFGKYDDFFEKTLDPIVKKINKFLNRRNEKS